jgi:hypothetical protein
MGRVLFHGINDVKLAQIADGHHIVVLWSGPKIVAYAVVPRA